MSKDIEKRGLATSTENGEHGSQKHRRGYLGPMIANISPALTIPLHLLRIAVGCFVLLCLTVTETFSQA